MKTHVTNPGRKTQRRNLTLAHQTSLRYIENLIIDIGHNIALNSRQYDTKLFCDHNNSDYFNDIGNDHFYVNTLKNTSKIYLQSVQEDLRILKSKYSLQVNNLYLLNTYMMNVCYQIEKLDMK